MRRDLAMGELHSAVDYIQAQRVRAVLVHEMRELFESVDVIAMPTTPVAALRQGEATVAFEGTAEAAVVALSRFTIAANVTGCPALSLPCGFDVGGLPFGLQLVARPFDEELLLRLGHLYQRDTDWHTQIPPC
jgi:aspartyl-tRNA(Asn)/glutamyl-tRNA(Gln) amidotransferase subunit A